MPLGTPALSATLVRTNEDLYYVGLVLTCNGATKASIRRVSASGQSLAVRGADNVAINQLLTVSDYEIPQSATLTYWAEVTDGTSSATTQSIEIAGFDRKADWMFPVGNPTQGVAVTVLEVDDLTYETTSDTAKVLNRADPVVVSWGRHLGRGTIRIATLTESDRREFFSLVSSGRVVAFQPRNGYGFDDLMFMSVNDVRETRASRRGAEPVRIWELDFQFVAAPPAKFTIVFGDRWQDIADEYASVDGWSQLLASGKSWRQVTGV